MNTDPKTTQALRDFLNANRNPQTLAVWVRDTLDGARNMADDLKYARYDADVLRQKANDIEARAVERLVEDITGEWTPEQIRKALPGKPTKITRRLLID